MKKTFLLAGIVLSAALVENAQASSAGSSLKHCNQGASSPGMAVKANKSDFAKVKQLLQTAVQGVAWVDPKNTK